MYFVAINVFFLAMMNFGKIESVRANCDVIQNKEVTEASLGNNEFYDMISFWQ
jgi:hypothetical protein